ncbi:MAG: hypothetical protein NTZ17_12805 [Phycisphaerae bacterium]|nr:hypothetical protein [Phycisphaerae bacterium]
MWNIFEQPWTMLGAAVLVLFGVLTFRSIWSEKRRPWQWLLPAGVAVLGVGLDLGVTTDLEKINQVIKMGLKAVETENCAAIARLVADDYQDSYHKDKESLLGQCRTRLVPPAIQKVRKIGAKVEVSPPHAKATLTMWFTFDKDSFWAQAYKPTALITVELHFRKQPDRTWLLNRAEVREVDKTPITWGVAKAPAVISDPRGS